jgi:hypothetical protein
LVVVLVFNVLVGVGVVVVLTTGALQPDVATLEVDETVVLVTGLAVAAALRTLATLSYAGW